MLDILRVQPVRVQLAMWSCDRAEENANILASEDGVYHPPLNELVQLKGIVTNMSCKRRIFFRDYTVPDISSASKMTVTVNVTMDPMQHILFEGILTDIPIGHLDPGQSKTFEFPISFVSCGRFDIAADAMSFDNTLSRTKLAHGRLRAIVQE